MQKQVRFKIKGMQRDLSASASNSEYAYENKNVRVMPTDESTLLSMINEKGNKLTDVAGIGTTIKVTPIGQTLLNDELVLFTAGESTLKTINDIPASPSVISNISSTTLDIEVTSDSDDRVYKFWFDKNVLKGKIMFAGDLGFEYTNPIEAISFYENEGIRKIYWTDGINQPRVMNIAATEGVSSKWSNHSFDFIRRLKLEEKVTITRNLVAGGTFAPGVIQYVFTYFTKYGQESNIVYTSPLFYVSYNNRGASPESKVGNSFNIIVENADRAFDYMRVYSIHRTSIDATPTVKRVVDLAPVSGSVAYKQESYESTLPEGDVEVFDIVKGKYVSLSTIPVYVEVLGLKYWYFSGIYYKYVRFPNGDYAYIEPTRLLYLSYKVTAKVCFISYADNKETLTMYKHNEGRVAYTDNGVSGDTIDPTELLYVGGEAVVFGTMAQKDNTLFLGDISLKRNMINLSVRTSLKGGKITFSNDRTIAKHLAAPEPYGLYPYDNQLKYSSSQIKTFKYLETYRCGVQFQHISGKWSEPIWINDVRNELSIQSDYANKGDVIMPVANFTLNNVDVINKLVKDDYIRVRPVVVYPTLSDRECVCQGVLCPTVYNLSDRYSNSPFVQSSWFVRPNAPFDINKALKYKQENGTWYPDVLDRKNPREGHASIDSRAGNMTNGYKHIVGLDSDKQELIDLVADNVNKGTFSEWRHNRNIPSNDARNGEIQCIYNPSIPPYPFVADNLTLSEINSRVSTYSENFYIDQSIVTLHSPEIEYDNSIRSLDTSGLKLRIIGLVPLTAFAGDIDIQTSAPPNSYHNSGEIAPGFYKEPISVDNLSRFGWRGITSGGYWLDELTDPVGDYSNLLKLPTAFVVYPFHRNGSLNNTRYAKDDIKTALLSKKKLSNIRYSYNTYFMNKNLIWYAQMEGSSSEVRTGISGVSVFDSNEITLTKLPAPTNSGLGDINYYGNVDKIVTYGKGPGKGEGYPIMVAGLKKEDTPYHNQFRGDYSSVQYIKTSNDTLKKVTDTFLSNDPVVMKYKSTPHAVLALNYTTSHSQRVLPTLNEGDNGLIKKEIWSSNYIGGPLAMPDSHFFWDKNKWTKQVSQDIIDIPFGTEVNGSGEGYGPEFGFLWLGELYNDNVINRFGGQTDEAFENNIWIPCGEVKPLVDTNNKIISSVPITWLEGDTYYQRYDHIKTYPFSLEEQNGITDIVSFMCETRVNIDGRYDRNRGQISNFTINPTNFNLLNPVYSQTNNFFIYRSINPSKINLNNFANSITWTKTKAAGELVDTWTNITLASTLDLDGDKGRVRSLKRFNNELIAFQDRGIAAVLYNSRTQLSSSEGVPVEIANSGKVDGKRYISDRIGCVNKWSICETPSGLYFIDDISKGIFLFNGQLDNIADRLGFHSWINSRSTSVGVWNPVDFNNFVTYYDKVNGDVFFVSKTECLAYSEPLGQFSSFYSYEEMAYMINLQDRAIQFSKAKNEEEYKIWLHNEGEYNTYFGKFEPFYTTVIANPNPTSDKIFDNIEFRADSWKDGVLQSNVTFDTLYAWNEYQNGRSYLAERKGVPSNLKKKFRVWRANIPRDKAFKRDRMRNPWLYIKLAMEKSNTNKTLLHDMVVNYFE